MPDYRRAKIPGGTYFFTVVTNQRNPVLLEDDVRDALRQGILQVRLVHPFVIDAWVLLPDHLHTIWTLPPGDSDFPRRWAMIKQHVSRRCAGRYLPQAKGVRHGGKGESGFWQRRFWEHLIRDEEDYRRHLDYIHWNPVKHGLVVKAAAWPFSTFHRYVRQGVYAPEWGSAEIAATEEYGEWNGG